MTNAPYTTKEAAEIFVERITRRGYQAIVQGMVEILKKGPPGRKPPEARVLLHKWYDGLDERGREQVAALVRETAVEAVFGCLVLLDNMTTGYPIEGKLSDFAVYLQTYRDLDSIKAGQPQSSVRLNPPNSVEGGLHDLFTTVLNESSQ